MARLQLLANKRTLQASTNDVPGLSADALLVTPHLDVYHSGVPEDVFTLSCFRRDLHDHHRALREMGTHKITAMFSVLPCDIITRNDWDDARLSKCDHARQKATDLPRILERDPKRPSDYAPYTEGRDRLWSASGRYPRSLTGH